MGVDQAAGDGQPEPGAVGRAGWVAPPQLVEDAGQVGFGDAAAAVGDLEDGRAIVVGDGHAQNAAAGGVPDAVDDQVGQHPPELVPAGQHRPVAVQPAFQPHPGGGRLGLEPVDHLAGQLGQGGRLQLEGDRSGLDGRQLEQVIHQGAEPLDVGGQAGQVAAPGRLVGGQVVGQGLGQGAQAGQRGAQVVGGPGDQVAPALLHAPLPLAGLGQAGRGRVQGLGDERDLGGALDQGPGVQVAGLQPPGGGGQGLQVGRDLPGRGHPIGHPGAGRHRQGGEDHGQVVAGDEHLGADRPQAGQGDGRRHRRRERALPGHLGPAPAQPPLEAEAGRDHDQGGQGDDGQQGAGLAGWDPDQAGHQGAAGQPGQEPAERRQADPGAGVHGSTGTNR